MKKLILYSLFILLYVNASAQEKLFTMQDVVTNSYYSLAPKKLEQLKWLPDGKSYSFVKTINDKHMLVTGNIDEDSFKNQISLSELNTSLSSHKIKELKRFPKVTWLTNNKIMFWNDELSLSYSLQNKKLEVIAALKSGAKSKKIAPNNKLVAFTVKNNLYLNSDKDTNLPISVNDNANIISGQSVHRNEFGIKGGIFWSPKSNNVAYYKMDQTMVSDYPLVKMGTTPAKVDLIKYPMAGQKSHHVSIGIYNIKNKKTVWLQTGKPLDQYLTNITWGVNEKYIYVAHLNRDQDHMQLIKYDAVTGEQIKILFEERDEQYIDPQKSLVFLPNDADKFIWNSERDGYNHLYIYNTNGKLEKQLTSGNWVVLSTNGFDTKGENIFITSTKENPLDKDFYSVNIKSGEISRITSESATHKVTPNSSGTHFIDSYTSKSTPRKINILDNKGEIIKSLLTSEDPTSEYKLGKQEIFKIKGEDNIKLYSQITYPIDFDSTKKYPVIVYVYGGPHVQIVTNKWAYGRYDFWFQLMAQKGFIIFMLDNRGSANRGLEFEQAVFGRLGTKEIEDQLSGVKFLKTKPWVDADRIGVYGWSYGGFMTTSLMLRTNDTYKVGVGGGSVIDWKYYEIMYGERYMDTPEKNPAGYAESSLLNYVENLNGKLLLVHGTLDPTVVIQNTLEFAKKAQSLNKPLDYFPYVGHTHGVRGKDTEHLYNKITRYFIDNL